MSLRTFTDSAGQEWQAFDVVPREDERRNYDRRSGEVLLADDEDRRDGDRRLTVGGRVSIVTPGAGWLCFERGEERRRLSPIPGDWSQCDDAQLETYCRSARAVRPSSAFGQVQK